MKLRKTATAAALAVALGASASANAITIDGITFAEGAIFETIDLFEGEDLSAAFGNKNGVIDQVGETLTGVGVVNKITDKDTLEVLWDRAGIDAPNNGKEFTFYFYDYVAEAINGVGDDIGIDFSGGVVELYSEDLGINNFQPTGTQAESIASATGGNLWLQLTGSPIGMLAIGEEEVGGEAITLRSIGTDLTAAGAEIDGRGLLDAVGGLALSNFDSNTFNCTSGPNADPATCPDDADKLFTSSGQLRQISAANQWGFFGTGEVQDVAIPVPGSLALMGLGLAGLGLRKRKAKA
jgi:hypothetical protein